MRESQHLIRITVHALLPFFSSSQVWNDELTGVAQTYAEQCVFEHNPNRVSQQNTFQSVGENLAASTGAADFPGFVQNWYDEVQDYNFETNLCNSNAVCGHYTQVMIIAILTPLYVSC